MRLGGVLVQGRACTLVSMEGVQGSVAQPGCRQGVQGGGGLHVDVGVLHTCVCAVGSAKVHEAVCVGLCTSACALLSVQGGACTFGVLFCTRRCVQGGLHRGVWALHTCARALGCV